MGAMGGLNFALPNLQGRVPLHFGSGYTLGQVGGEENHTLQLNELPAHNHPVSASTNAATASDPTNALWANGGKSNFAAASNTGMNTASILATGGSQPHNNLSPYLTLNFCMALSGIFPSQS